MKDYESLIIQSSGADIHANNIAKLIIQGSSTKIRAARVDKVINQGSGTTLEPIVPAVKPKTESFEDMVVALTDRLSDMDADKEKECLTMLSDYLFRRTRSSSGLVQHATDAMLKIELERRGWEVKATRTKVEEL